VVYLDIYKPCRGYYEVSFKLISDNAKTSKPYEITCTYAKFLEEHIQKDPENWLWSHRRWKHKRPENIPFFTFSYKKMQNAKNSPTLAKNSPI